MLTRLRARGLHIGVVTNCSAELGRRAAALCGVPFDAIVTAEEVGFYKPRPLPRRPRRPQRACRRGAVRRG